ncbi:MAG: hypothetical protein JST41_02120 [Bacteroidetes bacterium]|nr:hypothetical protein [Bacteroidota bacterium]MBX7129757.1 hypothetical protein [Flavobacteriales bacterium]MCC6654098.1 hypothetical protein [Flavobacteriales bacterium]HMU13456.1 hypothetical protein [Flavobacteriales bacterium]HNE80858.1 hypothetical protein [Flavobacteriales bacterium]
MGRPLRAVLILAIGIALGAVHDLLFINLNYQIDHVRRSTPWSFAHSEFQRLVRGWDLVMLTRTKWVLAALFVLAMWCLCLLLLRNAGVFRRLARPVTMGFAAIALLALLLHLAARWLPVEEASVNLLHAIQYPVLLLILQAALQVFPDLGKKSG